MVQSATALMAVGKCETALRALVYLACTQKPDGSFAQNFGIDGTPYWTGIQLDEGGFSHHAGVGDCGNIESWTSSTCSRL